MKNTLFRGKLASHSLLCSLKIHPIFKIHRLLNTQQVICYRNACEFSVQNTIKKGESESSLRKTIEQFKSNKVILEGNLIVNTNKEILLYFSKTNYSEKLMFFLRKSVILASFVVFIAKNPLYLVFPASIPIAMFSFWIYLFSFLYKINQRRNIVKEIWLDRNGEELKVYLTPNLRAAENFRVIQIKTIYNLSLNPNSTSLGFEDYPAEGVACSTKKDETLFKYWRKVYSIDKKYLLISKKPVYSRFDILDKVFEGKKVEFGRNTVYLLENDLSDAVKSKAISSVISESNPITQTKKENN